MSFSQESQGDLQVQGRGSGDRRAGPRFPGVQIRSDTGRMRGGIGKFEVSCRYHRLPKAPLVFKDEVRETLKMHSDNMDFISEQTLADRVVKYDSS